jgi:hypothetical protein
VLAGIPRCGSTWLANVLGRAPSTRTVFEPDGPISDILGTLVASRLAPFPVLGPDDRSAWYKLVWNLAFSGGWPWSRVEAARAAGRRFVKVPPAVRDPGVAALAFATAGLRRKPEQVVVKTVNSAFSLEWIAQHYDPQIVVLRRHPLNVLSSWLALGMENLWPVGDHPVLKKVYLEPLGLEPPPADASSVTHAAWNVGLLTLALKRTCERHPYWVQVSYDELSEEPLVGCKALFDSLGLPWTAEAAEFLERADDPSFVVRGGATTTHPNSLTSTDTTSRRIQQASQFRRRLTEPQIDEALTILGRFELGSWSPAPL